MKIRFKLIFVSIFLFLISSVYAQEEPVIEKPLYKPFIERYILDEIKSLRQDQQILRAEMAEKVAEARLTASDRAIRYTADTTNNIFYIITAAASLLVVLGWKSIQDIKHSMESTTVKRIENLTLEYEERLDALEKTIKDRSNQIIDAQKEISDSNLIHSLWMRAGLEKSDKEKLNLYDQILELNSDHVEALTYKADLLLDMDEDSWALSLVNKAIEHDDEYALAYWQRACAEAKLDHIATAIDDIKIAITYSTALQDELMEERHFENLRDNPEFQELAEIQ